MRLGRMYQVSKRKMKIPEKSKMESWKIKAGKLKPEN